MIHLIHQLSVIPPDLPANQLLDIRGIFRFTNPVRQISRAGQVHFILIKEGHLHLLELIVRPSIKEQASLQNINQLPFLIIKILRRYRRNERGIH